MIWLCIIIYLVVMWLIILFRDLPYLRDVEDAILSIAFFWPIALVLGIGVLFFTWPFLVKKDKLVKWWKDVIG
jgi:hypothetical protein